MQIQASQSGQGLSGNQIPLSTGQTQQVTIKERTSANTAVISLRGKEMTMTFENGLPPQNKVLVEIVAIDQDQIVGKSISAGQAAAETTPSTKIEESLKAAGLDTYLEEYQKQLNAYLEANPDAVAK